MKNVRYFLFLFLCGFILTVRAGVDSGAGETIVSGPDSGIAVNLFAADTFQMPVLRVQMKRDSLGRTVIDTAQVNQSMQTYKAQYESQLTAFLVGKPCPRFALKDPSGKVWKNSDLKGKVTLINTWNIFCGPCKREMPVLNELMKAFPACQFWAISPNTPQEIAEIVKNTPFLFTQLTEGKQFLEDNHLTAFPVDLIIDKKGIIRFVFYGADTMTHERLKEALNRMNAE